MVDPVAIPDHDPLMGYLLGAGGPVEIDKVELDSPALQRLREMGVHLLVPLISQGELIGTLNLGRRLSDQPYSSDDRRLLSGLAAQVAPAIRLAQMVEQQEAQAKEKERIDQELKVAALIQHTLLPKELPSMAGWEIDAYYRPARAVGGDFYDFIPMPDGRLGVVVGDVTDKGVPAALVMATTRSTLRGAAATSSDPGVILAKTNDVLVAEIPPAMFVTCLFGVLEPSSGSFAFANAGHNLPYVRTSEGVVELRATGMPLGLMPGMSYEVNHAVLAPGESMLLTSDGIVEAHSPAGEMFGFPRLMGLVGGASGASHLQSSVITALEAFCGEGHEQEDDITMVSIRRTSSAQDSAGAFADLDRFSVGSEEGNERLVMERVKEVLSVAGFGGAWLERLGTAVAEAAMNAIEHGNEFDPSRQIDVSLAVHDGSVVIRIADDGDGPIPDAVESPDLDAKLAGMQSPRGWGLFLIEQMVDSLRHEIVDGRHVLELRMRLQGDA